MSYDERERGWARRDPRAGRDRPRARAPRAPRDDRRPGARRRAPDDALVPARPRRGGRRAAADDRRDPARLRRPARPAGGARSRHRAAASRRTWSTWRGCARRRGASGWRRASIRRIGAPTLYRISRIAVRHRASSTASALLLAGWLASRSLGSALAADGAQLAPIEIALEPVDAGCAGLAGVTVPVRERLLAVARPRPAAVCARASRSPGRSSELAGARRLARRGRDPRRRRPSGAASRSRPTARRSRRRGGLCGVSSVELEVVDDPPRGVRRRCWSRQRRAVGTSC